MIDDDLGTSFVEADGLRIRVLTRNLRQGETPLVIMNGLGQSIEILVPLIEQLGDRPVVTFDMPGIGRSEMAAGRLSIPDYARLSASILRKLGIETYDLLGVSWGGGVAQQLSFDDPEGCRKLILAVTSAGGLVSWWGSPIALSEIMLPLRYSGKAYGEFIGPLMYGGEAIASPELFRDYTRNAVHPTLKGYYSQVRALCSWTSVFWLHRITQPVLVIAGALDALIPLPNQLLLAQKIPLAELKIYPAGHLVMFSRRSEIGKLMQGFLDHNHLHDPTRRGERSRATA